MELSEAQQAEAAANLYAAQISKRVRDAADGGTTKNLVRPDGTLDCGQLQQVARAR